MRLFSYITIFILIFFAAYLWIGFFLSESNLIVPLLPNSISVYLLSSTFIVYLAIQMYPNENSDITTEFLFLVITFIFIPVFIIVFAYIYRDIGLKNANESYEYIYFSIVTFTTLGYGDILPESEARLFSSMQALVGFIFVPLLISQFVNIVRDIRGEVPHQRAIDDPRIKEIIDRAD